MVTKQRHLDFYNLFQRNSWNGLLNVHNSSVCLSDFVKQDSNWNNQIDSIQSIEDFNKMVQDKSTQFATWAVNQQFNRESLRVQKLLKLLVKSTQTLKEVSSEQKLLLMMTLLKTVV